MRARRFLAILPAALVFASGCEALGEGCTEIGCRDALVVEFAGLESVIGAYAVTGTVDGEPFSCTWTLREQGTDGGTCDVPDVRLQIVAAENPRFALRGVEFDGTPDRVELAVARDGTELASGAFEPEYVRSQPNGPDCPPVCHNGFETLQF